MGEYIYRRESSSRSLGDDYLLFERNRIPEGDEELTPRKYLGDPFSQPAPKKSELDLIREEAESLRGKETSGEVLTAEEKEFLEYVDNVEAVLNKKSETVEKKLESLEKKKLQPKKSLIDLLLEKQLKQVEEEKRAIINSPLGKKFSDFSSPKTTNKNPETDLSQPKTTPTQQNTPSTIKELNEREDKDIKQQEKQKTLSNFKPSPVEDKVKNNSQKDSQSAPAPEITSPSPQQLKQRGEKFYLQQNYEAAYPIFSSLAKLDPKDILIQFFLTVSATKVGKYNEAIAASNKLIESGYRLNQAYYFQGIAYELQGEKNLARLAYQKASRIDKTMSEAHRAFMRLEEERLLGRLDRSDNSSIKGDRQEKKNTANKSRSGKNNTKKPASEKKFKDVTEFLRYRERQKKIKLQNTNLLSNDRERVIVAAKEEETGSIVGKKNLPGIGLKPDLRFAVPGTKVTYYFDKGEDLAPNHVYQYRWEIHNDKAALEDYRSKGLLNRLNFGDRETIQGPSTSSFEVTWDLVGKHRVICYRYTQGKLTDTFEYVQEVRDPVANATLQFSEKAAPALQPDVYLAQLELRKEILEQDDPLQNADKIKQLDEAIANVSEKLGVSEKEPLGNSYPLKAILVPKDIPNSSVPLQLYLRRVGLKEQWEIVDLTNPAPDKARTYSGTPDPNLLPSGRGRDAIRNAWQNFLENTPNPAGQIVASLPAEVSEKIGFEGEQQWNGYSNGISGYQQVRQWLSGVGFGAGLGAIALSVAPIPGSRVVAGWLLLTSSAAGAGAGALNIADKLEHGNFQWNGETYLDLADIVGGLAVGTQATILLRGNAAKVTQLQSAILISESVETGSDIAGGVIISGMHYRRIEEIRQTVSDEKKRKELILDELAKAAATGGLILLGMAGVGGGKKGQKAKQSSRTQYIEQHNHLNGILTSNNLIRLGYGDNYTEALEDIFNNVSSPEVINFYRANNLLDSSGNLNLSSHSPEDLKRIANELLAVNPQINFDQLYPLRNHVINKIKPKDYLLGILKELKKQNVNYLEVQGGIPGNLSYKEFQKILKEFEQLEDYQIKIGFLKNTKTATLGSKPTSQVNQGLKLIRDIEPAKDRVIGIDFAGPEAAFTPRGMEYFREIYREMARKAEEANKTMVIRVHVGEGNPDPTVSYNDKASIARNNVSLMIEAIETLRDNNQLSDKIILRLGHGTHASGADLDRIQQLGIIVEANLTSNLKTGSVRNKDEMKQVLLRFLYHDVKLTINTDGGGMMTTNLPREYKEAREILEQFRNNKIGVTVEVTEPNTGAIGERTYFYRDLPKDKKKNFKPEKLTQEAWKYRNKIAPTIPTN